MEEEKKKNPKTRGFGLTATQLGEHNKQKKTASATFISGEEEKLVRYSVSRAAAMITVTVWHDTCNKTRRVFVLGQRLIADYFELVKKKKKKKEEAWSKNKKKKKKKVSLIGMKTVK